jgi:cytochrome c-type biogenesis protein CcmF
VATGAIFIYVAFGAAGACLVAYLLAWSGEASARRAARALYALMAGALGAATLTLLYAILTNDFGIRYVSNYSSRSLPLLYKVSALWGGQEGTLLLWALLQAAAGYWILRRRDAWEPSVMSFLMVPQIFLLIPLLVLKPFQIIVAPADGAGLNPLLRDPWMAIHPPIVFLGYAVLAVPFALALAALARRRTEEWPARGLPWILFALLALGLGLFIGGFWAYKVLGWGGYWGWDPVENSSLAPWLVAAALLHGVLIQRATGSLKRTNLVLAASSYLLVIYSTFMTRSGVLANFSVHSFGDSGIGTPLIAALIVLGAMAGILLASRWRALRSKPIDWNLSLSAALTLGLILLLAGAALLVVGTSWPILSGLAGRPASPGPGFYNSTSLPIGVGLAVVLIAAPLMTWSQSGWRDLLRKTGPGLGAGVVAVALAAMIGGRPKGGPLVFLLLGSSIAALVASLIRVSRQARSKPMSMGAGIAHAGLALMFLGIVTTSSFDSTETVRLPAGRPEKGLGRELTFRRYVEGLGDESHFEIEVVPAGGAPYLASPIMFRDEERNTVIARPHIERGLLGDLYIAPVSREAAQAPGAFLALAKSSPQAWGPYTFTFRKFDAHSEEESGMSVGALVDVSRDGRTESMNLVMRMSPGGVESALVTIPMGSGATAKLDGMQVENGVIKVSLQDPAAAGAVETAVVEVSSKPLVNALWLGILLVGAGSALAGVQRVREERWLGQALPIHPEGHHAEPERPRAPREAITIGRRAAQR